MDYAPLSREHVWGIGLTRTGTSSLNEALLLLGIESVHWPTTAELLNAPLAAATDESVAAVFPYLDARYPGSKFILTTRGRSSWIASARIHRDRFLPHRSLIFRKAALSSGHWRDRAAEMLFTQSTLYGVIDFDEASFLAGYDRHHAHVEAHFGGRPEQLLTLDICAGEGWGKLCAFLGRTCPAVSFPRVNVGASSGRAHSPVRHAGYD